MGQNSDLFMIGNQNIRVKRRTWDKTLGKFVPEPEVEQAKRQEEWFKCYYTKQMWLADLSRNALIAVQAELHHQLYKSRDKTQPVQLGNQALRKLGFTHHDKKRALERLEEAKLVKVQWRGSKAPLVHVL